MSKRALFCTLILLCGYGHSFMSQDFTEMDWIYLPEPTEDTSFPVILNFKNDSLHLYNFGSDRAFRIGCQRGFIHCIVENDTLQITQIRDELLIQSKSLNYKFVPLEAIRAQLTDESNITMEDLINQSFTYRSRKLQIVFMDTLYDQGIVGYEYRDYVKSYALFTMNNQGLTFYDDGIWTIHEKSGIKMLILQGMMFPIDWYAIRTMGETRLSLLKPKKSDISKIYFRKTQDLESPDLRKLLDTHWVISEYKEFKKEFHAMSSSFQEPDSPVPLSFSDLKSSEIQLEFTKAGKYSLKRQQELLDYGDWLSLPGNPELIQIISRNNSQVGGIQYCRFINIRHLSQDQLEIYTEFGIQTEDNIKHIPMLLTFKKK